MYNFVNPNTNAATSTTTITTTAITVILQLKTIIFCILLF